MDLIGLYNCIEQNGIDLDWFSMRKAKSLSMPLPDDRYGIAIDPWKVESVEDELCCAAHELGHCLTGSFYNQYATCDIRQKHENRADRKAIRLLIPKEELDNAVNKGYTEPWTLAEYFGVTEAFMRKAMWFYQYGNLTVERCE